MIDFVVATILSKSFKVYYKIIYLQGSQSTNIISYESEQITDYNMYIFLT